jgi:diguanylate cyclase (GGDEF)-like protein
MSVLIANVLGFYSWKAITKFRHQQYAIQSELEEARKKAEYLAHIDPLTCLNNRRAFMEYGQDEFSRSIRHQRALSMVMIDIDDFKPINDKFGHQMGDEVLKLFSQTVYKQIRAQDIFGRIGGDEFGLLFPETNLQEAQLITDRVCRLLCQEKIPIQDELISPSFSAGVAEIEATDQSFEQLLQRADQKLYLAKQAGKHRVEV